MESIGRRVGTLKTGILHPKQKAAVESDSYGGPKCGSNILEMMMKLQIKWDTLSKEHGLINVSSKIIVDGVLLYGSTSRQLIAYFRTVLDVLKNHRAALKLKRCKWFQARCNFLGMDVAAGGTQPAYSKK